MHVEIYRDSLYRDFQVLALDLIDSIHFYESLQNVHFSELIQNNEFVSPTM